MSCACVTVVCEHTPRVGKTPDRPQEHRAYHPNDGATQAQPHTKLERAADSLKAAQLDRKRWEDALHLVQECVNACNERILAAEVALSAAVEAR